MHILLLQSPIFLQLVVLVLCHKSLDIPPTQHPYDTLTAGQSITYLLIEINGILINYVNAQVGILYVVYIYLSHT